MSKFLSHSVCSIKISRPFWHLRLLNVAYTTVSLQQTYWRVRPDYSLSSRL